LPQSALQYDEHCYAECHNAQVAIESIMLCVIILNILMLSVTIKPIVLTFGMLSVIIKIIMLSVVIKAIMLTFVMLSVTIGPIILNVRMLSSTQAHYSDRR
jgi:hypothetical protein